jgi:putative Ig domain-containing protein
MYRGRIGVLLVALVVALAACGPRSAASPSPSSSPSPSYAPLVIASTPLKAGEVGLSYAGATFEATGGVHPYMYQLIEGALPAGLTMSRDGVVSGSPTMAGDFSFSVQVVDSGGQANSAQDSIDIVPALTLSALRSGTIYVESGCDTACGGFATQTGGMAPYTYAVKSGSPPAGTSLSGTSLAGKFSSTGSYRFTVEATDALGAAATVAASFSVFSHIYFYCTPDNVGGTCVPQSPRFGCAQAGDHPDCHVAMPFAGGSGGSYSVSYRVTQGDPTTTLNGVQLELPPPGASPTAIWLQIPVQGPGSSWSGTLLITLTDGAICGPGPNAHCSAQVYVDAQVADRTPPTPT